MRPGQVMDELVVAALGPLEDLELHRQAVALAERADRDAGDAEPEVAGGQDLLHGHGSEEGVEAVEDAEVLVLFAHRAQDRLHDALVRSSCCRSRHRHARANAAPPPSARGAEAGGERPRVAAAPPRGVRATVAGAAPAEAGRRSP